MIAGLASPYFIALVASMLIVAGVGSVVWRHRHRPGAFELAALIAAILLWTSIYAVSLVTHDPPRRLFVGRVTWVAIAAVPVMWLAFVLVYTGYQTRTSRRVIGVLIAISACIGGLAVTNPYHGLIWSDRIFHTAGGVALVEEVYGPLFYAAATYVSGIVILGSILILAQVYRARGLYADQSIALVVGATVPIVANLTGHLGYTPLVGLDLTPYAFSVSAVAFGYAVLRFELFDVVPATRTLGRTAAISDLREGVLIVDAAYRIVDANRAGARVFNRSEGGLIGESLDAVFDTDGSRAPGEIPRQLRVNGRIFGVSSSPIRDTKGVIIGHTVVIRDITERELRKTQLEVLNRVLRHNLRNKLAIIQGYTTSLAESIDVDTNGSLESIEEATNQLLELSDRSREFERLRALETTPPVEIVLVTFIHRLVDAVAADHPEATISVDIPSTLSVTADPEVLNIALENLLSNAIEHNPAATPHVEIVATRRDDVLELSIADNGPGLPPDELDVLTAGRETAIEHGSGLGLWITTWAVRSLGGELTFTDHQPRGTRATIELPTMPNTAAYDEGRSRSSKVSSNRSSSMTSS